MGSPVYRNPEIISNHIKLYFKGETGLGKSTLMDSLFNTSFESSQSPHTLPTVKLKAHTYELQETTVRLKVSIRMAIKVAPFG